MLVHSFKLWARKLELMSFIVLDVNGGAWMHWRCEVAAYSATNHTTAASKTDSLKYIPDVILLNLRLLVYILY